MQGISSRALNFGNPENNKKKFQGQEYNGDLGLDVYEFKYRMDDPQIGRFWQIDPLSHDYVYNSTYAFSENKVIRHIEFEGLESIDINSNDPNVRALFSSGTQKQMSDFNKNAAEAVQIKFTVGAGVGGKVQLPGIGKAQVGATGPGVSVRTDLAGNILGEAKLGGAGAEISMGPAKLKAGTSVGNVKLENGKMTVDPIKYGASANLTSSKQLKQGGGEISAGALNATVTVGAQLGVAGAEVTVNVIKGGEAVVSFFGAIAEWGKSKAQNLTQYFGGGNKPDKK